MSARYLIGIDPGVKTGVAIWDREQRRFDSVATSGIIKAIQAIKVCRARDSVEIWFEDCRLRTWVDSRIGRERLQGVGSVKRDCSIWQEFCEHYKIPFKMIAPKDIQTKVGSKIFARLTKWNGRTSEHSRDAGMIVFGG